MKIIKYSLQIQILEMVPGHVVTGRTIVRSGYWPELERNLLWNSLLASSPFSGHNIATWGSKCLPAAPLVACKYEEFSFNFESDQWNQS